MRALTLVLTSGLALCCHGADLRPTPTRIILDPTTFPKISRPLLQDTANQVARDVDELIPGEYPNGASSTILCFVAKGRWADRPRAFVGKPWKIEPPTAYKYSLRVGVTPEVLPGAWQRLVFQLAHELAHQKMDARVDNNVLEAFAVAVSLEVLHREGYDSFRESNEHFYTQSVPPEVIAALNHGEWRNVGLYLRYEWRHEYDEKWDLGTHFVAAMAFRRIGNFPWRQLLNIGATAQCGSNKSNGRARYCPLSPASLEDFPESARTVAWQNQTNVILIARTSMHRVEGDGFTFQEMGRWVTLRWLRNTDPLLPKGFALID